MALSQTARNARLAGCRPNAPAAYFTAPVSRVETTEDAIARSTRVRAARDARRAAAVRAVPSGQMLGTRYQGGSIGTMRAR